MSFQFQADIDRLLEMITHHCYSNDEIFIRELISNSNDALCKYRNFALSNNFEDNNPKDYNDLYINISYGIDTITFEDNGIGMSSEELKNNLGTIAKSGTRELKTQLPQDTSQLIGQFGIGFYSGYLVASSIDVFSRKNNADSVNVWNSSGSNNYTVTEVPEMNDTFLSHGTRIVLHIRPDKLSYCNKDKIKEIVKKHSNAIEFPINLYYQTEIVKKSDNESTESDEEIETGEKQNTNSRVINSPSKIEEINDEEDNSDKTIEPNIETVCERLNTCKPLWLRTPSELTDDDYKDFFKLNYKDGEYYKHIHFRVEGNYDFNVLIFIPKELPSDFMKSGGDDSKSDIKLYSRRVFITDRCDSLVPKYLSFLRGIVDSNDLPLNISREILQENKQILEIINKQITKKIIECLKNLSTEDSDEYYNFYDKYNKMIKIGIHSDEKNRNNLLKLLRYYSIHHQEKLIPFEKYISEMKQEQKEIYYISGGSKTSVIESPFLSAFEKRNYDVILMIDPIDEYLHITEYDGKKLRCITKEGLELPKIEGEENESKSEDEPKLDQGNILACVKSVLDKYKFVLKKNIESVRVTKLPITDPCVITSSSYGWTSNMERIMATQPLGSQESMREMMTRKTLELNIKHPVLLKLDRMLKNNTSEKDIDEYVQLLYTSALLVSGYEIEDKTSYVKHIYNIMALEN